MAKTRIAIACQGGGSQTAFTAGALKGLLDSRLEDEFEIVSISGTSGGALCATLVWYGIMRGETPRWGRLMAFWRDNTAHGWAEQLFNDMVITGLRMVNSGLLPSYQTSPEMPFVQHLIARTTVGMRRSFSDLRSLLDTHIDFTELAAWGPRAERPALIIGAANVTTGHLAKFVSRTESIRIEHLMASCAVPTIFPAVKIGPHGYWDGLFSDNPPVEELLRPRSVGVDGIPEEIWLIKINPTGRRQIPALPADIVDRRNQLEGNVSLFQQLSHVEWINDMLFVNAFRIRGPAR